MINTNTNALITDDNYVAELRHAVNTIADLLKEETAASGDPQVQVGRVRAEVGREALRLGVEAQHQVLLGGLLQEALRGKAALRRMEM